VHINFIKTRQFTIGAVFFCFFIALLIRLTYIQILRNTFLSALADKQHKMHVKIEPRRGGIYDRKNRVLAMYLDVQSVYAVPREIDDKKAAARILARETGAHEETIARRLEKNNYFSWIKRKVDEKTAGRIRDLDVKGVYLETESKRFYPGGRLACHAIGITNIDNEGLEGVELFYDRELKGEYGWRRTYRDAKQREIVSFQKDVLPARDGNGIVLTIDQVIQYIIEKETDRLKEAFRPEGISIVAMDPKTGEILGLANYPWFDLNEKSSASAGSVRNRALSDCFEPGSIFKIVTATAALEEGIVDFDSEFFCENGAYAIGRRTLHDYRPYGTLTFRKIIEKSSNIGTVKVAAKLGREKMNASMKKFNFGEVTGIDLPGEVPGIVRDVSGWRDVDMTTIPMGQGIAVTALQLACAVSAVANDGLLMRPHIVKKYLNSEGVPVKDVKSKPIRRVMSSETSGKVRELLQGVVERGTGKPARLTGFSACGKTGTAQKVKPSGGYYKDRYIASFIGFAPAEDPAIALVVCVDNPRGKHFGSQVAAPAFKNIMEQSLSYLKREGGAHAQEI
jgi:cell division protein FtsI/penicillin-binding protein 2